MAGPRAWIKGSGRNRRGKPPGFRFMSEVFRDPWGRSLPGQRRGDLRWVKLRLAERNYDHLVLLNGTHQENLASTERLVEHVMQAPLTCEWTAVEVSNTVVLAFKSSTDAVMAKLLI